MKKRQYSAEFKQDAVRQIIIEGVPVASARRTWL
jgi:transposase-like protein